MSNVVGKITGAGNRNVLVTERGVSFGYNTLVSDMVTHRRRRTFLTVLGLYTFAALFIGYFAANAFTGNHERDAVLRSPFG